MTIKIKTKNARKLIQNLAALDVLDILEQDQQPTNKTVKANNISKSKKDLNRLPVNQQKHAKEILEAYYQGKEALEKNIPLKSAKDFLNEL